MSAIIAPPIGTTPPYPVCKWTVDAYHHLIQAGLLTEDDNVELLEGWIVPKIAHNPPHDGTTQRTNKRLGRSLPPGWEVRIQSSITTADSEPEPDLAVVREDAQGYMTRHPGPQDIGVVMEVADSSLSHDRQAKGRIYAWATIACYWIMNIIDRQVEVYTDPTGPAANPSYRQRQDYDLQAAVPLVLDGKDCGSIPVRELLS